MKTILYFALLLIGSISSAQQKFEKLEVENFQKALNIEFASKDESPLTAADKAVFKTLDFFAPDEKYFVVAEFVRTKNEKPFAMKTSTQRLPMYEKYGELHFTIDGKAYKLNVYRSLELMKEEYKDYLFLPFSDLTNGNETYLGGRYIDLKIPQGNTMAVDFNKAYNPYCAYNHIFSCPVVPQENVLDVAIRAGVKKFHD